MSENEKDTNVVNEENLVTEEPLSEVAATEPVETELPQATPVVSAPKKGGKLAVMLGAAAAVVLAAVVTVTAISNSPISLLGKGIKNSLSAVKHSALVSFAQDLSTGGSAEIVADLEDMLGTDGTASAKLYLDNKAEKLALLAGIELDGYDDLDAGIFCDKNSLSVVSECLLGDDAYGLGLKDLAKRFNASQFGMDGDYSLGVELPETLDDLMANAEAFGKDTEKIMEAISKKLLKSIHTHAEISKEGTTVQFGSKNVKTSAITVSMDDEQIMSVLTEMLEYLRSDDGIKTYLRNNAKYFLFTSGANLIDQADIDEFVEDFYDALNEVYEDLDDLADELDDADTKAKFTFHVSKANRQLIGVECNIVYDDTPAKITVYAGPDLKNAEEIKVRLNLDGDIYRVNYTVTKNDKKEFSSVLKAYEDDEAVFEASLRWNKETGDFKLTAEDWLDTYTFMGEFANTGKTVTIKLEEVDNGYETIELDITMTLSASDSMPAMPQFADLLDLTAEEAEDLINTAYENAQKIAQAFGG